MTRQALAGSPMALLCRTGPPDLGERPDRRHPLRSQREDVPRIGPRPEGGADPLRRVLAVAGERDLPHELIGEYPRGRRRLLELAPLIAGPDPADQVPRQAGQVADTGRGLAEPGRDRPCAPPPRP